MNFAEYWLEVVAGPEVGRRIYLSNGDWVVGRDAQYSTVVLADTKLARAHCRFFWRMDAWYVADLGANGVLVNSVPAGDQPVKLNIGDIVQVGDTVLRLTATQHSATAPIARPLAQPPYPISANQPQDLYSHQPPTNIGSPNVHVQVTSNNNLGLAAIALAIVVVGLGPCGLLCLGLTIAALLPYILLVTGVILIIVGAAQRFGGPAQPGYPRSANGSLLLALGIILTLASVLWIIFSYAVSWDMYRSTDKDAHAMANDASSIVFP
jgi:hypothetical protein